MNHIVISCGPIPARLDTVKFITNRFKGGLAFKTAKYLAENKNNFVTIVKWAHTPLPYDIDEVGIYNVVDVTDVFEYYKWFEENAEKYTAFIMAAAVANLTPSNPYDGKFPSHLYKVGEKFNIEFEIAPRAIDIIKKKNKRCCLIGYKLFDAKTDEELVEIAKHTLDDAKANVIFANKPTDAKNKKIAITSDGAVIPMTFDEHLEFITKAIEAEYFKSNVDDCDLEEYISNEKDNLLLRIGYNLVKYFEKTFDGFGTVAISVGNFGMFTTSRGHKGKPVLVTNVDMNTKTVYSVGGKATLNAPTLWSMLQKKKKNNFYAISFVIHRHFNDKIAVENNYKDICTEEIGYEFPGTLQECSSVEQILDKTDNFVINHHGFMMFKQLEQVDWSKYYELFPKKYFGTREEIEQVLDLVENNEEIDSLEIGGNTQCRCKYNLDTNVECDNNISYEALDSMKFDYIVARNSINYLSETELKKVIGALKDGSLFIANTFVEAPEEKITDNEVVVFDKNNEKVHHFLIVNDTIYYHTFYGRTLDFWKRLGFKETKVGNKTYILRLER